MAEAGGLVWINVSLRVSGRGLATLESLSFNIFFKYAMILCQKSRDRSRVGKHLHRPQNSRSTADS